MPEDEILGRVGALEQRVGYVEQVSKQLQRGHKDLTDHVDRLDGDIQEIKVTLGNVATKDDIVAINQHIDTSINVILRDALNAIPGRYAAVAGIFMSLLTAAGLAWTMLHGAGH